MRRSCIMMIHIMMIATFLCISTRGEDREDALAVKTLTTSDFDEETKSGTWLIKFYAVSRRSTHYTILNTHTHTHTHTFAMSHPKQHSHGVDIVNI